MHFRAVLTWLVLVCAFTARCHADIKWDLAAAYPDANFHTQNLRQFASDVALATGGELKITVHANASLFKAPEIKRAVQTGQAPLGEILLAAYQDEWLLFGLDSIPFLASSYEESARLFAVQKPGLEKKLSTQGLVLLYSVPWPPQGMFSKRPVDSGADLKNTKWRAYSPATLRFAELLGAQPVTVQAAELSQALASGVVETYMASGSTGLDAQTHQHLKYFYDVQAWLPKNAVVMNKAAYEALDKPLQTALLQAAARAQTRGWALSRANQDESLSMLRKNGMRILAPSVSLNDDLREVGNTMREEWVNRAGPEGRALIEAYQR